MWWHCQIHYCHSNSNGRNIENIDLVWNSTHLLGRQTVVSVSCGYRWQILHIWSGLDSRRKLIAVCGKFVAWAAEFGPQNLEKICHGKLWFPNCNYMLPFFVIFLPLSHVAGRRQWLEVCLQSSANTFTRLVHMIEACRCGVEKTWRYHSGYVSVHSQFALSSINNNNNGNINYCVTTKRLDYGITI